MLYICYDYAVMGKYLGVDNNWFKNPHISGVSFHDDIVDHIRLIDRVEDVNSRFGTEVCVTDEKHWF